MEKKIGFTLLEIMVTLVLLTLVAAIGGLAVVRSVQNARITQAESELEIMAAATLQLAWDTGKWPNKAWRTNPGSVERWFIDEDISGLMGSDGSYDKWKGPYYEGNTLDPWGNPYFFDPDFRIDGVMRIVVGSFGPNGVGRNRYDSDDIVVRLDD